MKDKSKKMIFGIILISLMLVGCDKESPDPPVNDPVEFTTLQVEVVNDVLDGVPIVVAASNSKELIVAFKRTLDGEILKFSPTENSLPAAFVSENGTIWDIFGNAMSGIDVGKRLEPTNSMMGFWFSFATFYPGLTIYPGLNPGPNENEKIVGSNDWTIPSDEVRDGGPGKDGIPAIEDPEFVEARNADFLNPHDLVVGFFDGTNHKAYPHKILNWHEIVNETTEDQEYSIIYCPLTGTATCWSGIYDNGGSTFGVSGLLYNSNIIPYDRRTESYWSQIKGEAVKGPLKGTAAETLPVVETTWEKWREMFPETIVLSTNTGYSRDYNYYPYGYYNQIDADYLIFGVKYDDQRLPKKQRVLAVIEGNMARAYQLGLREDFQIN